LVVTRGAARVSGGEWVEAVCLSLLVAQLPPAPVVSAGRLMMSLEGSRLRLPIDEISARSGFAPGERGWVTFRVEVR
jgi:hypothetical protein